MTKKRKELEYNNCNRGNKNHNVNMTSTNKENTIIIQIEQQQKPPPQQKHFKLTTQYLQSLNCAVSLKINSTPL